MSRAGSTGRGWRRWAGVTVALIVVAGRLDTARAGPADTNIDVWYGNDQTFGALGRPQAWANVLGRVSDPDGVVRLRYRLNGGASTRLFLGPGDRRLAGPGDFNVQLSFDALATGANSLVLEATDGAGHVTTEAVTVHKVSGATWPLPSSIEWSRVAAVHDVAQVVDGRWAVEGGVLRTVDIGYDRLVAIGDVAWTDYEIVVPITVHYVDRENGSDWPSNGPGIGLLMRWTGHRPTKAVPYTDFRGHGALGWYRYNQGDRLVIGDGDGHPVAIDEDFQLVTGVTYLFRMRVETHADGSRYQLKVWPQADPEPAHWTLTRMGPPAEASAGSVLLLAHHVDASFGDVTVIPVAPTPVVTTPTITPPGGTFTGPVEVNIATSTPGSTIHYTTDGSDPSASSPRYTGAFLLTSDTEVRAIAVRDGHHPSAVASATFDLAQVPAQRPTMTPPAGSYDGLIQVVISAAEPDAVIHYTLDGTKPDASSPVVDGPLTLTASATVRAITIAPGFDPSRPAKATYTIT